MAKTCRIKVNPDILIWAINESGKSEDEIQDKFPNLYKWIEENVLPTFKQVEELANYLKVPFGYFLLSSPPEKYVLNANFRSINNLFPQASKNLRDTLIDMSQKQDWLIEYRKDLGFEYLEINKKFNELYTKGMNYYETAEIIVKLIELSYDDVEKLADNKEYYSYYRNLMENFGISVFQNGVVGNNTHRKLDIKEFRAFALIDTIAPIIFINNTDSIHGKIFSIVHEFVHILLGEDDVFTGEMNSERYINNITAEILIPREYIYNNWGYSNDYISKIENISTKLKVSREAIALKLLNLNLIGRAEYLNIKNNTEENIKKRNGSGGNYHNNINSKLSANFKKDVISSVESNITSYTEGFRLLGNINANTYDFLKEKSYEN